MNILEFRYHAIAGRHAVDPDSDYSDEDTYHSRQERRKDGFSCPELEHNLDMLIDATEQKILHVRINEVWFSVFFGL